MKKLLSALLVLTMLFSVVSVSVSADEGTLFIDENFNSMEAFLQNFVAGAFYVEDGLLFGYNEAVVFCTLYDDQESGMFTDSSTTWLTFDMEVTLSVGEDEFYTGENRSIALSYCNDNLFYEGRAEGRAFMNINYDITNKEFTFTDGISEDPLTVPVPYEVPVDDEAEFFSIGMSVDKGRIRFFYNGEMLYDLNDTANEYLIGHVIESPLLFWNHGNFIQVKNVKISTPGYLYPYADNADTTVTTETPVDSTEGTDAPVDNTDAPVDNTDAPVDNTDAPVDNTDAPVDNTDAPVDNTNAPVDDPADTVGTTGTQKPSTSTGDATFVVVAAMVAALGSALIVKKVRG